MVKFLIASLLLMKFLVSGEVSHHTISKSTKSNHDIDFMTALFNELEFYEQEFYDLYPDDLIPDDMYVDIESFSNKDFWNHITFSKFTFNKPFNTIFFRFSNDNWTFSVKNYGKWFNTDRSKSWKSSSDRPVQQ